MRDANKKSHDQQAANNAGAGGEDLPRQPAGQRGGQNPGDACAGEGHAGPEQFAEHAPRQLAECVAPNERRINPAHLDFADAQLGHHEFAGNMNVLPHQIGEKAQQEQHAEQAPACGYAAQEHSAPTSANFSRT